MTTGATAASPHMVEQRCSQYRPMCINVFRYDINMLLLYIQLQAPHLRNMHQYTQLEGIATPALNQGKFGKVFLDETDTRLCIQE